MKKLLARIGLIRLRENGTVHWPFYIAPLWIWQVHCFPKAGKRSLFGVFRNRPGVIKWEKGRLLPRRWGIRIGGLEIGDRG